MKTFGAILVVCVMTLLIHCDGYAQIYTPEGMNMPGAYDGWNNPPATAAFAGIQGSGTFLMDSLLATRRYTTLIHVDASAADAVGGTYNWLFTSGPSGGYYNNKWNEVTVIIDSLQQYTHYGIGGGGTDNSVTLTNGNYYTVNYRDNGYANTSAIWISTASPPVSFTSVTQSPLSGSVTAGTPVTVTVNASAAPSVEENVYVRYSTDNFASSTLASVSFVGATGTATIPGMPASTSVKYYAFSTKVVNPASDYDMKTIKYNNNNGANYSYVIPSPTYTITATAGPNGSIAPPGTTVVSSGGNQQYIITPSGGFYIDSIIVDNVYAGNTSPYNFTNVTANHTIHAVFAKNVNVTFRVNMKVKLLDGTFLPGSGDNVTVRGSFNDWGTSTNNPDTLTDADNDSIYTKVKSLKWSSNYAYKFWKTDRAGMGFENDISDRQLSLAGNDTTLPAPYFNDDAPVSPNINVTFLVDMSIKRMRGHFRPDSGDVVTVRGTFNDWGNSTNNPDTLKDLDNDSVYTKTISIPGNQTIQYKFWKTFREFLDYESISNREYDLLSSDVVIPVTFFDNDSIPPLVTFSVLNRWNLLSVPNSVADARPAVLFPAATSSSYGYNGAYFDEDTLINGYGYWLKFPADDEITLLGNQIPSVVSNVSTGWNVIGSASGNVLVSSIVQNPPGIVQSSYFGYNNGYSASDTIFPGKGYWVKVSDNGTLTLNSASIPPATMANPVREVIQTSSVLIVTDAEGNQQSLFIAGKIDKSYDERIFEMPPISPAGVFDARFASGKMVEAADGKASREIPVQISSAVYPVTVSWDANTSEVARVLSVGSKKYDMTSAGSATLRNASEQPVIQVSGVEQIPVSYGLAQNYPNPFNPSTVIRYQLPVESFVTITVFNVLGQEVATLVDGMRDAGYESVQWDAANVPTGIYFYRINAVSTTDAGFSFSETKKMMLMK